MNLLKRLQRAGFTTRQGKALEELANGTSSAFAGTTIGTSAMVGSEIIVTFSSVWGINGASEAYYDAAGAVAGEAAVLMIDPATNEVVVIKPEGANAP